MLAQLVQRALTILRVVDFIALADQRDPHHPPDLRVIVDDENPAAAHAVSRSARQGQGERGARLGRARDGQRAAVRSRNLLHDRQPDAGSGDVTRLGAAIETLEDTSLLALRDAPVRCCARRCRRRRCRPRRSRWSTSTGNTSRHCRAAAEAPDRADRDRRPPAGRRARVRRSDGHPGARRTVAASP